VAGKVTPEKVEALTGWCRDFINRCAAEVRESPYSYLLGTKRRPLPKKVREAVYARDGRVCAFCGSTSRMQIDHRHPVALGGTDDMTNLQVLCQPCNLRKGARLGVVQG
jgi:5-methylcytosine-specific restriction endonuclease McrA